MTPWRTLPPAGTLISALDVAHWLARTPRSRTTAEEFRELLRSTYGIADLHLLSSGRAAMAVLFRVLATMHGERAEVLVPGYTCYSVAASAIRAGLRIRPVDIDPDTLDYDHDALERVDTARAVGVVSANLFGIPNDLDRIERFARRRSIRMIDDAAQAMHARVSGRHAGTFGDAGILSLDKGKNITTVQGGVLLVRDPELVACMQQAIDGLNRPTVGSTGIEIIKLILYSIFLHPTLYGIPSRLLSLGQTPVDIEFPIRRYPSAMAPMAVRLFRRIDRITAARVERAEAIMAGLAALPTVRVPRSVHGTAVYPRLPLLLGSGKQRDWALRSLEKARLGASGFYPKALIDVPELGPGMASSTADTPQARQVAERLLTLPTHQYVSPGDIRGMVNALTSVH